MALSGNTYSHLCLLHIHHLIQSPINPRRLKSRADSDREVWDIKFVIYLCRIKVILDIAMIAMACYCYSYYYIARVTGIQKYVHYMNIFNVAAGNAL